MTDTTTDPEVTNATAAAEEQKQKNITRDDVRVALADVDPNNTNSGRIREILGRGSLATIQKYLEELRAEKVPQVQQVSEVPNAPKDLINAVWQAAYQAAQSQSFSLVATSIALKDQALARVVTLEKDIAMFVENENVVAEKLQTMQDQIETYELKMAAIENTRRQDFDAFCAREAQLKDQAEDVIVTANEALLQAEKDAAHKDALHQQQRDIMRVELARLTDQVGELKAHLYQRAAATGEAAELKNSKNLE
jgi:hypothetical protein